MAYTNPDYGSVEHYSEHFSDVIADVGDDSGNIDNVINGFVDALTSWLDYHNTSAQRYELFSQRLVEVLTNAK